MTVPASTLDSAFPAFTVTVTVLLETVGLETIAGGDNNFSWICLFGKCEWIPCNDLHNRVSSSCVISFVLAGLTKTGLNLSINYIIAHFSLCKACTVHFKALALSTVAPCVDVDLLLRIDSGWEVKFDVLFR